jgi:hypothetical protein
LYYSGKTAYQKKGNEGEQLIHCGTLVFSRCFTGITPCANSS